MKPYLEPTAEAEERVKAWASFISSVHHAYRFAAEETDYQWPGTDWALKEAGFYELDDPFRVADRLMNMAYANAEIEKSESYLFNPDGTKKWTNWTYRIYLNQPGVADFDRLQMLGMFRETDSTLIRADCVVVIAPCLDSEQWIMYPLRDYLDQDEIDWFAENLDED